MLWTISGEKKMRYFSAKIGDFGRLATPQRLENTKDSIRISGGNH
jgi:hypothetical protein